MKFVSIVTPCRNEERFIGRCLDSIVANDFPKNQMEVLVVDGMSTDRTREIVTRYVKEYPFIKILNNPKRMQTFGTNIGIITARGDVIIRMDAHAECSNDYITKCLYWLERSGAECVGGPLVTKPGLNTITAEAIAMALSHPFGVGNGYFRTGTKEPRYVDTVAFGCYSRQVFERIGLFNEKLSRTDDIEFNLRLKKCGGQLLLVPGITSYYYARPTLISLAKQNFGNGFWVIYSLNYVELPFSVRHLIPFLFVLSLVGGMVLSLFYRPVIYLSVSTLGFYIALNIFFSLKFCFERGLKYLTSLVLSFSTLHLSYGVGSICGFAKLTGDWLTTACKASVSRATKAKKN